VKDPSPPPWEGGLYSTKRHGVAITHCDAEPVRTPGCIQDCGALLVLRRADLTVVQASENSAAWLGEAPERLLGRHVAAVLGDVGAARLREMLDDEGIEHNPTYALALPALRGTRAPAGLDVTVHAIDAFAIVELEPLAVASGSDPYALVRRATGRLQAATSLQSFCDVAADEVRRVTRFDRVMIYRFHPDAHGEVVAESKRDDLSSLVGHHYPATDIPRPAREIFQKMWVRPLPDARCALHELVPLANPDTGQPLEMTYCALRGASVMYTDYLRNMDVAASLTMAIRVEGRLWGLIACHHLSAPAPVPWPVRAASELLAQVVSLQLKAAEDREHFAYRLRIESIHQELIAHAAKEGGLGAMLSGAPGPLEGLDAGGAAIFHWERWWRVGETPDEAQLEALASWLDGRPEFVAPARPPYVTDCLSADWPEGAAIADVASGVLAISLSRSRRTLMLWFRPETVRTLRWAGDPSDKPTVAGPHGARPSPRTSFAQFVESVRGRSRPWLAVEIEAATRLRLLIMELVVSRAEKLATLNADLSRSNEELDSFAYVASHDLKEPLRGIHKHAHHLLADARALDEPNRHRMEALMRLTVRMDGLLDSLLYFSRVGRIQLDYEDVELGEILDEAIEMVGARATERHHSIHVARRLPVVRCDRIRMREALANLLSNGLKYNDRPERHIEVGYFAPGERVTTGAPAEAHGQTIFFVRDNGIGIEPRHAGLVWNLFKRLHARDAYGGGSGAGLTIVKKLIERHGGQIWLESKVGEGTTFFFTLPASPSPQGGAHA
jgi:light-regulated signal transduction histidine kinase (bacteriophytochrome)